MLKIAKNNEKCLQTVEEELIREILKNIPFFVCKSGIKKSCFEHKIMAKNWAILKSGGGLARNILNNCFACCALSLTWTPWLDKQIN